MTDRQGMPCSSRNGQSYKRSAHAEMSVPDFLRLLKAHLYAVSLNVVSMAVVAAACLVAVFVFLYEPLYLVAPIMVLLWIIFRLPMLVSECVKIHNTIKNIEDLPHK